MDAPPSARLEMLLQHRHFLRALARELIGDEQADDLVQQTWLRFLARREPLERPRSWLASVARNLAKNRFRSEQRRRAHEDVAGQRKPTTSAPTDEVVARLEVQRKLVESVLALEEPLRTVIVLRFYEELPPRQIAARLGVPVETVRSRVRRGLERLRQRLDVDTPRGRESLLGGLIALAELEPAGIVEVRQPRWGSGRALRRSAGLLVAVAGIGLLDWWLRPEPDPLPVTTEEDRPSATADVALPALGPADGEKSRIVSRPPVSSRREGEASETGAHHLEHGDRSGSTSESSERLSSVSGGQDGVQVLIQGERLGKRQPLAGARVWWAALPKGAREIESKPNEAITDEAGAISITPSGVMAFLAAQAEGHQRTEASFALPLQSGPFVLVLPALAEVAGRVRGPGGDPHAGAIVHLCRRPPDAGTQADRISSLVASAPTEEGGRFRLAGVQPGEALYLAVADPVLGVHAFPLEALEPGETTTRDLTLPRITSIHGRTMPRSEGDHVEVRLSVETVLRETDRFVESTRSGRTLELKPEQRGFRLLQIAPGKAQVVVQRQMGDEVFGAFAETEVAEGETVDVGTLEPARTELRIQLGAEDAALAGLPAEVRVLFGGTAGHGLLSYRAEVLVGREIVFHGVPVGRISAEASLSQMPAGTACSPARSGAMGFDGSERVVLKIERRPPREPSTEGELKLWLEPPPGATGVISIWVLDGDGVVESTVGVAGSSGIASLPVGRWELICASGSHLSDPIWIEIRSGEETAVTLDGPWRAGESLEGRCLDGEGQPVAGAHVALLAKGREGALVEVSSATSNERGEYRIDALPPLANLSIGAVAHEVLASEAQPQPLSEVRRGGRADLRVP